MSTVFPLIISKIILYNENCVAVCKELFLSNWHCSLIFSCKNLNWVFVIGKKGKVLESIYVVIKGNNTYIVDVTLQCHILFLHIEYFVTLDKKSELKSCGMVQKNQPKTPCYEYKFLFIAWVSFLFII